MNKSKKIIVAVMLVAILLMAVGYAALNDAVLEIGGTATAKGDDSNFKVWFTGDITKTSGAGATAAVTAQTRTATVTISDLTVVGEEKYVILEIENASTEINATKVTVTANPIGTDYIKTEAIMCDADGTKVEGDNPLNVNEKTYVKVSASLLQTITSEKTATIAVKVTAVPQELD